MSADTRIAMDAAASMRVDRVLGQLAARAENVEGGLRNVGEALLRTTDDRFETQADPDGHRWAPLTTLTRELRGASEPILTRSGRLRRSVNYQVGGNTLRLGPNVVYDAAQQFGAIIVPKRLGGLLAIPASGAVAGATSTGRGWLVFRRKVTLPPRAYIGFGPKDEEAATEAVEEWLEVEDLGHEP